MSYDTTEVETTHDIRDAHAEIGGKDVATIRTVLLERGIEPGEAVAWVAEWLTDEKQLVYVGGRGSQVAVGRLRGESDKAWQFAQEGTEYEPQWLPKSQARMFTLASGVSELDDGQATLEDL